MFKWSLCILPHTILNEVELCRQNEHPSHIYIYIDGVCYVYTRLDEVVTYYDHVMSECKMVSFFHFDMPKKKLNSEYKQLLGACKDRYE